MEITKELVSGVTRVVVKGRVDANSSPRFEAFVSELSEAELVRVTVNCTDMEYISSAGLRVFLTLAKRCKAGQGQLALHSLNDAVLNVFTVTGFSTIIPIFKDEQSAKEALN
jgi:anti-anti-sigma factor